MLTDKKDDLIKIYSSAVEAIDYQTNDHTEHEK